MEDKLKETEQDRWDGADRLREHVTMESISEVAKDRTALAVSQSVTDKEPLNAADNNGQEGRYDRRERI